tara:strand:- start:948 stop:2375 length:1428 start_codon:yes stop_codon:yes gene_type:complete
MNNVWGKLKTQLSNAYAYFKYCCKVIIRYANNFKDHTYNNSGMIIQVASHILILVEIVAMFSIIVNPAVIIIAIVSVIPLSILYSFLHRPLINLIRKNTLVQATDDSNLLQKLTENQYIDINAIEYDELNEDEVIALLVKYPEILPALLKNDHTKKILDSTEILSEIAPNINMRNYNLILELFENASLIPKIKKSTLKNNKMKIFFIALSYAITDFASYAYALFIISSVTLSFFAITSNLPIIIGFFVLGGMLLTPLIIRKARMLKTIYDLPSDKKIIDVFKHNWLNNLFYSLFWAYIWCVLISIGSHYLIIAVPFALPYAALLIPVTTFAIFLSLLFNFESYTSSTENLITNISVIILYTSLCLGVIKIAMTLGLIHINLIHTSIAAVMIAQIMPCLIPLIILTIIAIPIFANFPKILINSLNSVLVPNNSNPAPSESLSNRRSPGHEDRKKGKEAEKIQSFHPDKYDIKSKEP